MEKDIDKRSNLDSAEAMDLQQRSEFIKKVNDFAQYMHKEYIEGCGNELALMLCAMDLGVGDGKAGAAHIVLGDKATLAAGVSLMMQQEGIGDIFRVARLTSDNSEEAQENAATLRKMLRVGYGMAVLTSCWSLLIIGLLVFGINDWATTASNLLLMAFLEYMLYRHIRGLRRDLKRIEEEERKERLERLERAMGAFAAILKDIAGKMNSEDDEDE